MTSSLGNRYRDMAKPARASMWFVICSFIQKGVTFFTTPFFTRMLSTDAYGTVVIYNSWYEIITILATFQLATGVFNKAMIKFEDDRDGYTSSTLVLASVLTGSVFGIYIWFADLWNGLFDLPTCMMIMLFLDIFFSTAMSLWSIRNRFEYRYKSVILLTLTVNILGPLLSILLIILSQEQNQAYAKIGGVLAVKILVYLGVYLKILQRGKTYVNTRYWKYALIYNIPLIPHYLSQQVLSQSDRIMINKLCGSSDAGIYGVAYQLSMALFIFTLSIHNSFTPWTFESIRDRNYRAIGRLALKIEIGVGLACFAFSLFAPELIYILGGKEYSAAVWIVPPVTMSILFQTIYTFFGNIEFYFEKTKFVMVASLLVAVLNVGLNAVFIPLFGFVAAGYTTLFCYAVYSFVHYWFMVHICRQNHIPSIYDGTSMWICGIVCIILSFLSYILYLNTAVRYVVILTISIAVWSFCHKHKAKLLAFIKSK